MALIEDQALPTTIEDVNKKAFTPGVDTQKLYTEILPPGGITPYSEYNKALPPGQPGQFFIGGEEVFQPGPPAAEAVSVVIPGAAPAPEAPFDVAGFLESMIPSVDSGAFSTALEQQLATLGETEDFLAGEIAGETERRESEIQAELAIQQASLEAMYAPQYDEIQTGLLRAQESAAFGGAAAGSVRGSRAAQKQVDLSQQASKVEQALAAEQGMQLRLIEAQLREEPDEVLDALNSQMSSLSSQRQQVQVQLQLAEEELLSMQAAIAAEVQEQQFQLLLDSLDAQGLTIDPFTGQTVSTLEGEKLKANAALTDAKTAEIYTQLQQPDLSVKYFSDEVGNTYANVFDAKTGVLETVDLGRLSAAQKWAIEALNAPVMSGYGGTGTAAAEGGDAIKEAAKALLAEGETVASLGFSINNNTELTKVLTAQGFSHTEQVAIAQAMFDESKAEPLSYYQSKAAVEGVKETVGDLWEYTGLPGVKDVWPIVKGGFAGLF